VNVIRSRIRILTSIAAVLALVLAACSGQASGEPTQGETSSPGTASGPADASAPASESAAPSFEPVELSYGTSSQVGFAELPTIAAFDELRADTGIDVQLVPFQSGTTGTAALVAGEVDMGILNPPALWAANNAGERFQWFNTSKGNEWRLVARADITDPSQLDGARIAHHGTGITMALALSVGELYDVEPQYLEIPGSEARVQALLQDQIDASPVDVAGVLTLERLAPGEFHVLLNFDEEFPDTLFANSITAPVEVMDENCEMWETIADYLTRAHARAADDPEWVADLAVEHLPNVERDDMLEIAQAYSEEGAWFAGNPDEDMYEAAADFYVSRGLVEENEPIPYDEAVWAGC
jgi:ABC-type nitrate/sulfonate/bicarbonate transport system substrate-binding protein